MAYGDYVYMYDVTLYDGPMLTLNCSQMFNSTSHWLSRTYMYVLQAVPCSVKKTVQDLSVPALRASPTSDITQAKKTYQRTVEYVDSRFLYGAKYEVFYLTVSLVFEFSRAKSN